jgi:hypothetical protein
VKPESLPDVGGDRPLRLSVAAALAFPDGSMTASGLRREGERSRLVIERIAGKVYTTLVAIEKMRELCRKPPKDRAVAPPRAPRWIGRRHPPHRVAYP